MNKRRREATRTLLQEANFPPCVGCGYCCLQVMCDPGRKLNQAVHKIPAERCPWLEWDGTRYRCRLAKIPDFAEQLAVGEGCSSSLNTWRKDVRYRG